jgi:DNA-binding MarR family transcriptional regulator
MIRKSNYMKDELLSAVGRSVQAFQDATDEVDEAVAARLGLNRTDLRCLSVLSQAGAITASELADAAGLTRGAMTTALDRIERAGYARRAPNQNDRRSVRVEMTDRAIKEVEALYGPLAKEGRLGLQKYTEAELATVLKYLEDGRRLQRAHAKRIRALGQMAASPARPMPRGVPARRPRRRSRDVES